MEVLEETATTSTTPLSAAGSSPVAARPEPANPADGRPAADPERKSQIFAWIAIAAIWGMFAVSLYIIWMKANTAL